MTNLHPLGDIGNYLEKKYKSSDAYRRSYMAWENSPFAWLLHLPSRTKGKYGEQIVEEWLRREGFALYRSNSLHFDRICRCNCEGVEQGIRLEIKFSLIWESGLYVFQQIRNQEYDLLFCLGISPNTAHAWCIPKQEAWEKAESQHAGGKGKDTKWIRVKVTREDITPKWLDEYGGEIGGQSKAIELLRHFCCENRWLR